MPRAFVVSEVRTFTKVVAAFAVALLALALWGSPAWAQVTSLDKSGPDEVLAGDNFTYTITVRTGPNPATNVVVEDVLPAGVDLDGPLPDGCTFTEATNTVRCDLGTVAASTTRTITLNVEAPENPPPFPGTITNTATCMFTDIIGPCTDFVTTEVLPAADLVITKEANPEPVDVGDNLAYTLRVTNRGPQEATGVELVDDLPGNVIFIGLDEREGDNCDVRPGQVVDCELGDLAPNTSTRVRVFVEPEEAGTIRNIARVSSDIDDPNRDNNVDSVTTTVEGEAGPTEPPEETTGETTTGETTTGETTTGETTTGETTTGETTTGETTTGEANSLDDGEGDVVAGTIPEADELPETGGPGGYVLAAGCALLGVGLILNRIAR